MEITNEALNTFIESFAHHSAIRNYPALVEHFAETFLAAGPAGAQCVRAADFARALPRRTELFESLGCEPAKLIGIHPSPIDDRYALVRTTWRFTLRGTAAESDILDSASIFLVDTGTHPYRILAYINPQDILETVRQRKTPA